jgi:hypothetical protein
MSIIQLNDDVNSTTIPWQRLQTQGFSIGIVRAVTYVLGKMPINLKKAVAVL